MKNKYLLRLYICRSTPKSALAVTNIKRVCAEYLDGRYRLEVIDINKHASLARDEQIVAVPTLIKRLPLPLRRFRPMGELVRASSDLAPRIQFPLNGSRIDVDRSGDGQNAAMPVKVAGGVLPMTVLVNGASAGEIDSRRQRLVEPPGPGFARLTVIDATGAADTVVIRIQ